VESVCLFSLAEVVQPVAAVASSAEFRGTVDNIVGRLVEVADSAVAVSANEVAVTDLRSWDF
jgi:hypothetical protein